MKKNVFKTVLLAVIFAGVCVLSSCKFAPSSTTAKIKNESGVEIVYWLEYRLGSMQDTSYAAPTLADGESKTWNISAKLSATADKEWGLAVYVMSKSELDSIKAADPSKKDSDILMYNNASIHKSFDADSEYSVVIKGVSSSSDIKLK